MIRRACASLAGLALLLGPAWVSAAEAARDQAGASAPPATAPAKPVAWHDSMLYWVQRASTQTLGVGPAPLTRNPFYDWVFYLWPRYTFWENERSSFSVRGQLWADYEFSNGDTTTREHEFWVEDTVLALAPEHAFVKQGDLQTDLTLSLPRLVLPTSKPSFDAGLIAALGAGAYLRQDFPLREADPVLQRGHVALRLAYGYQFARSIVPERSTLNQIRMDVAGHSVTNDQLAGAALAEHILLIHGVAGADLWRDKIGIDSEFGIDPSYKFRLQEHPMLCGVVLTGCAPVGDVSDPQHLGVATFLDINVEGRVLENALRVAVGYENISDQLGPDGQRRSFFWSPDAKFYLKVVLQPDLLLGTAKPPSAREHAGFTPRASM